MLIAYYKREYLINRILNAIRDFDFNNKVNIL